MSPHSTMSCENTPLAIIYVNLKKNHCSPGEVDSIRENIVVLEEFLERTKTGRYLGIYTAEENLTDLEDLATFHISAGTYRPVSNESAPLLALLHANETSHVIVVGVEPERTISYIANKGFKVCVFLPATRLLAEIKEKGVLLAENISDLNPFPPLAPDRISCVCDKEGQPQQWCTQRKNQALWRIRKRLWKASMDVQAGGWVLEENQGDSYWKSNPDKNMELLCAIEEAEIAGIPCTNELIHIYLKTRTQDNYLIRGRFDAICKLKSLKRKIAILEAELEKVLHRLSVARELT